VKRISSHVALVLLVISLVLPSFVVAQTPGVRRASRGATPETTRVQKDFDEALKLVQEQYIDGRKLNYNEVYKSSIIGMLRSLDPHSNYYDREEFDELKTDQRSEYFATRRNRYIAF